MMCSEFQRDLPELMEGNGSHPQEEHLRTCAVCSDLVQDLRYIAEAAKLLVPMHDPSQRVWEGIEKSIKDQTPRPAGGPERPEPFLIPGRVRGSFLKWAGAAAVAVFALAFVSYNAIWRSEPRQQSASLPAANTDSALSDADQDALSEVTAEPAAIRSGYEQSLRSVNAYIRDAEAEAKAAPNDPDARYHVMNAYEQKASLYEMASSAP